MAWWSKTPNEIFLELRTKPDGLDEEDVLKRKKNIVYKRSEKGFIYFFFKQFKQPLLLLLLVASLLSFLLGEVLEGSFILFAVFLSAFFGAYLEWRGEKALKELNSLVAKKATVLRGGKEKTISAEEIVEGDVIVLKGGDVVPADAIVFDGYLKVDESNLTGESVLVEKKPTVVDVDTPVYERKNMVFSSTRVVEGYAKAVVVAVGEDTEIGRIKSLIEKTDTKTPMEKRVEDLSKIISFISITVVVITLFIGFMQDRDWKELVLFSIVLAVAAVPEGLTTVMTVILALGVSEMAKHNALVKNLSSVDALGSVDVIVSDKTGTLTYGTPEVVEVKPFGVDEKTVLLYAFYSSTIGESLRGDDVEEAIAKALGSLPKVKRKVVVPFSSDRKYMCVEVEGNRYWKGAVEVLTSLSELENVDGILEGAKQMEEKGLRVIAVAVGSKPKIVGLIGLGDKIRTEASETIEKARDLGVDVVIVTGDSKRAALSISKQLSISNRVVEWKDIKDLDEDEIYEIVKTVKVVARATPESKYIIVKAFQKHGHIVAVTGDGVNDAPALKKGDVAVVMGKRGTDVSKEIADVVLVDDNLYTLVNAIKYGRTIFYNISNFIRFQLTTTVSAVVISLINFLTSLPLPFFPSQLVWVNLIMDGPPAVSQAFERPKREVEKSKPIKSNSFLDFNRIGVITYMSLLMVLIFEYMFYYIGQTVAFNSFVFMQLANALNARSIREPFYKEIGKNPVLIFSIIVMAFIQYVMNSIPFLRKLFYLSEMNVFEWFLVISSSLLVLFVDEVRKRLGVWTR